MNNNKNHDDKGFLLQLHMRAQQKAKEYSELLHERQRLEMNIERAKEYLEQLNNFLKAEGEQPVAIRTMPYQGSAVGKPGNRSKAFPIRKAQWNGMGINEIIEHVLNVSQGASFNAREMASEIYEIQSESDLKMVMRNIRSYMQRGARGGMWERADRGKFKAKTVEKQGALVNT